MEAHDSNRGAPPLSLYEALVLAELERQFSGDDGGAAPAPASRGALAPRTSVSLWVVVSLIGAALVAAGLVASVVVTAFCGFVVMTVGVHQLSARSTPLLGRRWRRIARSHRPDGP